MAPFIHQSGYINISQDPRRGRRGTTASDAAPEVRLAEVTGAGRIVQFGAVAGVYFVRLDYHDHNRVKYAVA
jgi:hypothetical protein